MKFAVLKFSAAVVVSLAVHAVVLFGVGEFVSFAKGDLQRTADEMPKLDVTRVDLSLTEEEDELAVPSVSQPAVQVRSQPEIREPEHKPLPEPMQIAKNFETDRMQLPPAAEVRETRLRPPEIEVPQIVPAPVQARVDKAPVAKRKITPKYPIGSRKRGEHGDVTLEFEVDVRGVAIDVKVVGGCGFPELERAAIEAVRKAVFNPAMRDNKPVSSRARFTMKFNLKDAF